ncbi:hypothetical protein BJ138DRAFT_1126322 [Hygrophoropsis aurantiaca]|uniref:Uncharacterized protein n=1 Tax=Hygrophoropsis aurantiaca TaxID=72124 RepID=A0ACB8AD95_9AGAM|nr:hypothetical protein BJ138DRAFT_1126322 [Hygrophoropsis aurantiaca]
MAENSADIGWLVADSEDEDAYNNDRISDELSLGPSNALGRDGGTSTIQTATFTTRSVATPPRLHSPDITSASLFTPVQPIPALSTISPSTSRATISTTNRPRPRPRPKVQSGKPFVSAYDELSSNNNATASSSTSASNIAMFSSVNPAMSTDPITNTTINSSNIPESLADGYSPDIAERAKMRSRKARDKSATNQSRTDMPPPKKAVYRPSTQEEVIELTDNDTSDDELYLRPPPKRQKSQKAVKSNMSPKSSSADRPPAVDLHFDALDSSLPIPQNDHAPPSQPPASTMPTVPPSTPPQIHPSSPLSSPAITRKRKRIQRAPEWDADSLNMDDKVNKQPSPPIPEPPPFFASSSSAPAPTADVPEIMPPPTTTRKGKKPRAPPKNKKEPKAAAKGKGKKKAQKQVDEPADETPRTQSSPVSAAIERPLSPVPSSEAEDEFRTLESDPDDVPATKSRAQSKKMPAPKLTAKQKGKRRAVLSDAEDEDDTHSNISPEPPRTKSRQVRKESPIPNDLEADEAALPDHIPDDVDPGGGSSQGNFLSDYQQISKTSANPAKSTPLPAKMPHRSFSVAAKSTPMSELIKRVNSRPNSPFANPRSSGTAYSSSLKSSRSLLSKIAPLHMNRRTPPPPLPKPPPPKKTKKQIQMEERIEEELAETVEGWSCMTDEERRDLRRARIEVELGGYD